jgi:hypothetical protein
VNTSTLGLPGLLSLQDERKKAAKQAIIKVDLTVEGNCILFKFIYKKVN